MRMAAFARALQSSKYTGWRIIMPFKQHAARRQSPARLLAHAGMSGRCTAAATPIANEHYMFERTF